MPGHVCWLSPAVIMLGGMEHAWMLSDGGGAGLVWEIFRESVA